MACEGRILGTVEAPCVEALEAIGGTGDTLTGIVAALVDAGRAVAEAALVAARVNRLAGELARPSPRTAVAALIERIPEALRRVLDSPDPTPHN